MQKSLSTFSLDYTLGEDLMKLIYTLLLVALFCVPASSYGQVSSRANSTVLTTNKYLGIPISPYDSRVNAYSPYGAQNKYTSDGGRIYAADGTYLGRLNSNRYDTESVSNPYGIYGSKYSSTSINNPYSTYGSPYSSQSATNPYTTTPPRVIYGQNATPPVKKTRCYYNC